MKSFLLLHCSLRLLVAFFATLFTSNVFTQTIDELRAAAVEHVYRKEYAEAEALFTKILEIDPRDEISYLDRGLVRESQHRIYAAIDDFGRQIAVDSSAPDGWFLRGILLQKTGDTLNAMKDFEQVVKLDYYNSDAHLFLGQGFEFLMNYDAADTCYRNALLANPENTAVLDSWIPLALTTGDLNKFDSLILLQFERAPDQLTTDYWNVLRNGLLKEVQPLKIREGALSAGMKISEEQLILNEFAPAKWSAPWLNAFLKPVFGDVRKDTLYLPAAIKAGLTFRADKWVGKGLEQLKKQRSRQEEYLRLSAVYFAQKGNWKKVTGKLAMLRSKYKLRSGDLLLLSKAQLNTGNADASCETYRLYLSATEQPVLYPFYKQCEDPNRK